MRNFILACALFTSAAASASPAQTFLHCASPYTGTHSMSIENGSLVVKTTAHGYVVEVPLAVSLGIKSEDKIVQAEFALPLEDCLINPSRPQLSCTSRQTQITFTAQNGQRVFFRAAGVTIATGVIGEAAAGRQQIELEAGAAGKVARDVQSYKASYNGVTGYSLCGRAIQ